MTRGLLALLLLCTTAACSRPHHHPLPEPAGVPVRLLPLEGPLSQPEAEISGMSWFADTLVLLPQYPERFGHALFAIDKSEIQSRLDAPAPPPPLRPRPIPFQAAGLDQLPGYEGLESIAFAGTRAWLTVETSPGGMRAFILAGEMIDGALRVETQGRRPIEPPVDLENMSHEALVVTGGRVLTFFEANGPGVNPNPVASVFDLDLTPRGTVPFPALDFRVADATTADADGRFWISNLFYVGDTHLRGASPRSVEQLVELRWTGERVERTGTPPIVLRRVDDRITRNWEGLVRLDDRGFLMATDTYPQTLLGFVPRSP